MHSRNNQLNNVVMFGTMAVFATFILIGLCMFSNWHSDKMNVAAKEYEACIKEQYETTPTEYYYQHGEYPKCETENNVSK